MNDIELIQKCIEGDLNCYWKLYEKYIDKIYRFVYIKVTDVEVAEDITSDVFMTALNKISSFKIDENANVNAWFYKIAYNKVIDYYKSNKIEENIDNCLEIALNTDFWKDVDNRDKLKEIFMYVKSLKKEHRDVFFYRFWEDLSYKEIAEITWMSVDNCKQIVSRTLKAISANFAFLLFAILILQKF